MAFVEVISLARCRKGSGTFVQQSGCELAVFRLGDPEQLFVIDNTCPHAGGNLSGGDVDGTIVTCRWHQWSFDLASGVCTASPRVQVRRYPAEVRDGSVWVDLPD